MVLVRWPGPTIEKPSAVPVKCNPVGARPVKQNERWNIDRGVRTDGNGPVPRSEVGVAFSFSVMETAAGGSLGETLRLVYKSDTDIYLFN
jgi:hypothetical protein